MSSDLVSVIIPVYNASNFIIECLISVQKQTFKNLQVIVVNDGSTDSSLDLIQNFIKNDARFELVNQENKGCSAAKNKGLEFVKGDFVQYLDADDVLSSDKIENQIIALENNFNSIAVCKTIIFQHKLNDTAIEIDSDLIMKGGSGEEFLLRLWGIDGKMGMVQPNAYLIPTDVIKSSGYWNEDISNSPAEDGEYFTRILLNTNNVIFTKGINYYRKIKNISSVSKGATFENAIDLFKTIKLSFQHYFLINNSSIVLQLYAIHLTNCAYQFGNQYPELFDMIEFEFNKFNIKGYRVFGHTLFSFFARIIGFKNAMLFRKLKKIRVN